MLQNKDLKKLNKESLKYILIEILLKNANKKGE